MRVVYSFRVQQFGLQSYTPGAVIFSTSLSQLTDCHINDNINYCTLHQVSLLSLQIAPLSQARHLKPHDVVANQ